MSQEKHRRPPITQNESSYDLKVLGLGSAIGHDWTSIIQENCLATNNQSVGQEGSESKRKTTGFGILMILVFCGAALWILISQLTQVVEQINPQSIEQVRNY
jgi:hypothetical protein